MPCQCCLSVAGRPPAPAVYRWTGPHGNVTLLCASCCACWRENAWGDPSLTPQRIEGYLSSSANPPSRRHDG